MPCEGCGESCRVRMIFHQTVLKPQNIQWDNFTLDLTLLIILLMWAKGLTEIHVKVIYIICMLKEIVLIIEK